MGEREAWLEVSQTVHFREHSRPYPVLGDEIRLDGRHVADLASFFCAMGEAVNGPGGYCGTNLVGLSDFLQYASRPSGSRTRLVWREYALATQGLARSIQVDGATMSYLDLVTQVLAEDGVDVMPS